MPGFVAFDDEEIDRIERVQCALILQIPPHVVDEMPYQDVMDVLYMHHANEEIKAWAMSKGSKRR